VPTCRIVFAGTPDFVLPVLEAARSSRHELAAVYTRPDRLARSRAELRDRIAYCQRQLELRWSNAQIRETADYLNERFYHYPE